MAMVRYVPGDVSVIPVLVARGPMRNTDAPKSIRAASTCIV